MSAEPQVEPSPEPGAASAVRRRDRGLTQVTVAGVRLILGAGNHALIGEAVGESGCLVWLTLRLQPRWPRSPGSYAQLTVMYPKAGASLSSRGSPLACAPRSSGVSSYLRREHRDRRGGAGVRGIS